jgi:transmembrane sensor
MTIVPWRRPGGRGSVSEEAATWVLMQEQGELSATNQRHLAEWLSEDAAHVAAYEDALLVLDAVARHAGDPEMLSLRTAALSARGDRRRHYWAWASGIGVAATMLAAVALWTIAPRLQPTIGVARAVAQRNMDPKTSFYRTGVGERSAIALPDGSVATLDTDSQLRVVYTATQRRVFLLKGQALFEVAHGKPAPFQVLARGQQITAVGTMFNVRIEGRDLRVAMVEGTVRVRSAPGNGPATPVKELMLTAGEGLVAEPAKPLVVHAIDAQQIASWKGGLLVFNDTPLSDAVAEINRYTLRPIAIADIAIGAYRVSGVFESNNPKNFAQAMGEVFPIEITYAPDGATTLRTKAD